jgi:hypothetical protein
VWRATAPLMFAATALFGLAAAICGPIVLYLLIVRGVREQRWSWLVLGVVCAIPWLLVVYAALKKAIVRTPPPPPPPSGSPPGEGGANGTSGRHDIDG